MRAIAPLTLALLLLLPGGAGFARADDAAVLPGGVWRLMSDTLFYLPIEKRYDADGDVEAIAADYNRPLDSRLFPLLAPLDSVLGRRASIGDAIVSFEYELIELHLRAQYGLTDRLSVGIDVPYWWAKNDVRARLDSGPGSSANVGLNPRAGAPGQPPLIPLAVGGRPLTTEDVQSLLGPGLAGIPGFGYRRVDTWSDEGFGDFEAGFRYVYPTTRDWRSAFTGGVRFPTGQVDDPDNLVDFPFGSGAYALLFRLGTDVLLSNLWTGAPRTLGPTSTIPGPGELMLNGTFRYDLVLPDKETKRVPDDVNNPITLNRERVSRDLGDRFEFEVSARYGLWKGLYVSPLYKYTFKLEDEISGTRGFAYESLEKETAITEHILIIGLFYSTVPLYQERRFWLPLTVSVSYRNRFAGSNNVFRSQYVGLGLEIYF